MAERFVDPYVSASTGLLVNKLGLRDEAVLREFEYEASALRIMQLREKPIEGRFDMAHLCKLHQHIFQDVYDWAGQPRTVNISKGGTSFAKVSMLESYAENIAKQLEGEKALKGLEKPAFVDRLAHYYAEWNALHPFREGNGRSTREMVGQLAREAGYELDQTRIDNDKGQWNDAAKRSFQGDLSGVKEIFAQAVRPSRAIAFERLPERDALARHPELRSAYGQLRSVRAMLEERHPDNAAARVHFTRQARAEILRKLDAGKVVEPERAPAPRADRDDARTPAPVPPLPARAKAFQAVADNRLARDDALKLYPELRPAFNQVVIAQLKHGRNALPVQQLREGLQRELNAGRVPGQPQSHERDRGVLERAR